MVVCGSVRLCSFESIIIFFKYLKPTEIDLAESRDGTEGNGGGGSGRSADG